LSGNRSDRSKPATIFLSKCAGLTALSAFSAVARKCRQAGRPADAQNPKTGAVEVKLVSARILYVCYDCKRQFSVTEGAIFNDTHLSLDKWLMAPALMVNAKKGLSALQLKRDQGGL